MTNRTLTVFARCVSAELRSRIAVSRDLKQQDLAGMIGKSQNYVSERLRDVKPFSLDDVEQISLSLGEEPIEFLNEVGRHMNVVFDEMERLGLPIDGTLLAAASGEVVTDTQSVDSDVSPAGASSPRSTADSDSGARRG